MKHLSMSLASLVLLFSLAAVAPTAAHAEQTARKPLTAPAMADVLQWISENCIQEVTPQKLLSHMVADMGQGLGAEGIPDLTGKLSADLAAVQAWLEKARPGADGKDRERRSRRIRNALQKTMAYLEEDGSALHLPHQYMAPPEEQGFDKGGVGLLVDEERDGRGRFVIIETLDGFPAQAQGVRPGDCIVKVAGHPVLGLSYREMADLVRGPLGSKVQVDVERAGSDKPISYSIERVWLNPNPKNISSKVLDGGVGYIRIKYLGERLDIEIEKVLEAFRQQNVRSLVLDLRNNEGLLSGSRDAAGCFLPRGSLVTTQVSRSGSQPYVTLGSSPVNLPIVVLVNKYSSGAAILLAGALRDAGRAQLVGDATIWRDQPRVTRTLSDGSVLSVTTGYYKLPKGQVLRARRHSLQPDVVVTQDALVPLGSERDEQYRRAVEMGKIHHSVNVSLRGR